MKQQTAFPLLFAFLILCGLMLPAFAEEETVWIVARVTSTPVAVMYDLGTEITTFWEFNITVLETNNTSLTVNTNLTAITNQTFSAPTINVLYNFTGHVTPGQGQVLAGTFIITKTEASTSGVDWWSLIMGVFNAVSGVVQWMGEAIAQVIYLFTGFAVPTWIIAAVVVIISLYTLFRHWKAIALILVVILAFLATSGSLYMLRILFRF